MYAIVVIAQMPFLQLQLPAAAALGAVAILGYMMSHARHGRTELTLVDVMILMVLIAIVAAAGIPLIETVNDRAKTSVLRENLHTLRSQIEFYAIQHRGQPPTLSDGTFPQLLHATDLAGVPGEPSGKRPFGPYLRGGVPVNPLTGCSIVTATDVFPPAEPSGNGGWIYHQATGRVAADLKEFLNE